MHDTRPFCATLCYVDLPQVDHGGRRARGRVRATRATKLRVVDLCRLQEFKSHYGANNFYILKGVYIS